VLRKPEDNAGFRVNRSRARYEAHGHVDCQSLWRELAVIRDYRTRTIERCKREKEAALESMAQKDPKAGTLKSEIGFLQTELLYERILRDQTAKIFENSCPGFDKLI
jgi:hypothetical protein